MAKHEEEELLADASTSEEVEGALADSVDATDEGAMEVENFDLAAWVGGLSPVRRAVTIYGRQDLLAEIDIAENRLQGLAKGTDDWRATVDQIAELRAEYNASALDVVVRALDADQASKLFAAIQDAADDEARAERELEYTAAHIVEPAGLGLDELKSVHAILPREVDRITVAATMADHASLTGVTAQFRQ